MNRETAFEYLMVFSPVIFVILLMLFF
jgi:hypothetical protein